MNKRGGPTPVRLGREELEMNLDVCQAGNSPALSYLLQLLKHIVRSFNLYLPKNVHASSCSLYAY